MDIDDIPKKYFVNFCYTTSFCVQPFYMPTDEIMASFMIQSDQEIVVSSLLLGG